MAKKIKLELTEIQLLAVMDVVDTIEAGIGFGSDFDLMAEQVKLIDKMLRENGYSRNFK